MLPRAVLTHLKAGVRAAFGPDPVLTIWCARPASATLVKHTEAVADDRAVWIEAALANPAIEVAQKLVTQRSFSRTGFPSNGPSRGGR